MPKIQTELIPLKDVEAVDAELDRLDGLNTSASIAKLTRIIEGFANGEMQRRGRDKIYELHQQGVSGVEIANATGYIAVCGFAMSRGDSTENRRPNSVCCD